MSCRVIHCVGCIFVNTSHSLAMHAQWLSHQHLGCKAIICMGKLGITINNYGHDVSNYNRETTLIGLVCVASNMCI